MTATTYAVCEKCDFENRVEYERDGYKVMEVWVDNDDHGFECVGCRREMDADKLYATVQESVWEPE